jgi:hypothetical protein
MRNTFFILSLVAVNFAVGYVAGRTQCQSVAPIELTAASASPSVGCCQDVCPCDCDECTCRLRARYCHAQ